jgi:hypothetical protein
MKPLLPDDAADMIDYLLGFGSDRLPPHAVMQAGIYNHIATVH